MDIAEIRSIVIREAQLPLDARQISDTTSLDDAGITSLARMNVILALEDHFHITFPDEMMTRNNFASITAVSKTVNEMLIHARENNGSCIPLGGLNLNPTISAKGLIM